MHRSRTRNQYWQGTIRRSHTKGSTVPCQISKEKEMKKFLAFVAAVGAAAAFVVLGWTDKVEMPLQDLPKPSYTPFTHAPTVSP